MYSRINNDESSVGGLILAAGLSTRMGQSKPLTKFLDKKLIDQTIKTMQEAHALCKIFQSPVPVVPVPVPPDNT